ncbi:LINE-1 retrotransposable element ORF2 protein [Dissostichus eleginoides]|uniref:LINE-1 retrotransposable element ORF2 protein n=1 Tax=Dissostichus eleginoides TaxID=100907 RepID=A0AAD9C6V4_DISEL|nr:LINE-1 retrotransposable element ORF2 protein [Dissostichus eleginoides]
MIVCRRKLKFDLIGSWTDKEGRLAIAKICLDGQNIALISAYAPNTFEAGFYDQLTKTLRDLTGFRLVMAQISMQYGIATWIERVGQRVETNVSLLMRYASGRPKQI